MHSRKDHVITATKGDAQPSRLVAIAVDAECVGAPGESDWQRERLVSWSASGWARDKSGGYREWHCRDGDAERWWRACEWGAKRSGVTWLVAVRAVRTASLLDLWSMIDDGRMQWDGAGAAPGAIGNGGSVLRPVRSPHVPMPGDGQLGGAPRLPCVQGELSVRGGVDGDARLHQEAGTPTVVIDDPPTVLRLRLPGRPGRIWWCDARNWGIDPEGPRPSAADEARWLADAMRRMVDCLARNGWGGMKATAGSQALATWRRRFMTHEVRAHNDDGVLALEEQAYIGGRCECGVIGPVSGPLYWVDRRSAYGHACATVDVPLAVRRRLNGQWNEVCGSVLLAGRCIAEAGVDGGEPSLPQATRDGFRYPIGRRSCVLAGPELADAVRAGVVRWIGECVEYDCAPALRAYARDLWGERRRAEDGRDGATAAWLKRLIVSLPGKLGQRVAEWSAAPGVIPPAPWAAWYGIPKGGGMHRLRSLGNVVQRQSRAGWTYDAAPAVACWILSAARVELLNAIRAAGWDECVYWDTDSLLLTQRGYDALCGVPGTFGDELGQWRLVRVVQSAVIKGVKHYIHDGVETCAGMPRADVAQSRLSDRYWYRQTFGMALQECHRPSAERRLRVYKRAPRYVLGRVGDGGKVYPHVVNDW